MAKSQELFRALGNWTIIIKGKTYHITHRCGAKFKQKAGDIGAKEISVFCDKCKEGTHFIG